ncbi:MAG TPA: hypothetical protein VFZ79_17430 [Acidimicrobiales bacterium]
MPRIEVPAGDGPEVTRVLGLVPHFVDAVNALEITDLTLVLGKYLAMGRFMQVLDLDQACTIAYDADGKLVTTEP